MFLRELGKIKIIAQNRVDELNLSDVSRRILLSIPGVVDDAPLLTKGLNTVLKTAGDQMSHVTAVADMGLHTAKAVANAGFRYARGLYNLWPGQPDFYAIMSLLAENNHKEEVDEIVSPNPE